MSDSDSDWDNYIDNRHIQEKTTDIEINKNDNISYEIDLLKKLTIICSKIQNNIKDINNINFIDYIKIINDIMLELSKKHSQKINKTYNNTIKRHSYTFCKYNYKCPYFYSTKLNCKLHHYPYNFVYNDTKSLLLTYDETDIENINKSINTISYIINHMYNELLNIKTYSLTKYKTYLKIKKKYIILIFVNKCIFVYIIFKYIIF